MYPYQLEAFMHRAREERAIAMREFWQALGHRFGSRAAARGAAHDGCPRVTVASDPRPQC